MSSYTRDQIIQAAGTHATLLAQIAEVEYAPSTLRQQEAYLTDLKGTLAKLKKELEALRRTTSKERKDHQDLRDSFGRRYAHKMTGRTDKFHSKIEKEEREFLDALQNQEAAEEKEKYLETTIADTEKQVADLATASQRYEDLRRQYENLYRNIFEGQTQEFPEEDQVENAVKYAKESFEQAQTRYNSDSQASKLLTEAEKLMRFAVVNSEDALSASKWDMMGGGLAADIAERDKLSKAQAQLSQAQMLLMQATFFQPAIGPFGDVNVATGHYMGDVLFDNIFTDYSFHNKLKQTRQDLVNLHNKVKQENQRQKERVSDDDVVLKDSQLQLANARLELERVRRGIFDKVLGQVPPAYDNAVTA